MKILAILFLALTLPLSATSYPSGDPTVRLALSPDSSGLIVYGPDTPMSGYPIRFDRGPGGAVQMWFCYLPPAPNCTTPSECPACPDQPGVVTIPLREWCRRLDLLVMPQPPLPTDQRYVCLPEWR